MRDSFQLYTTQAKYWSGIMMTIAVFGAGLGYVGVQHASGLPKLSLSTVETDKRFTGIESKIINLDDRLTIVERKNGNAVATQRNKAQ